jgi:predicted lactoylglutathione lyase
MSTAIDTALQATTIMPNITVNDIQASVRFFEGLGFVVDERWEDNGALNGVTLRAGNLQIGLSQDDWKKGRDREKGVGMRIFIETTQNVDDLAARAKQAGVTLDGEPHDTGWGSRAFDVTEPSGFKLTISSPSSQA